MSAETVVTEQVQQQQEEEKRRRKKKTQSLENIFDWARKEMYKAAELFTKRKSQIILETANRLEETGVEPQKISMEIIKNLEGFVDDQYVREVLTDYPQYKDQKHANSARQSHRVTNRSVFRANSAQTEQSQMEEQRPAAQTEQDEAEQESEDVYPSKETMVDAIVDQQRHEQHKHEQHVLAAEDLWLPAHKIVNLFADLKRRGEQAKKEPRYNAEGLNDRKVFFDFDPQTGEVTGCHLQE